MVASRDSALWSELEVVRVLGHLVHVSIPAMLSSNSFPLSSMAFMKHSLATWSSPISDVDDLRHAAWP